MTDHHTPTTEHDARTGDEQSREAEAPALEASTPDRADPDAEDADAGDSHEVLGTDDAVSGHEVLGADDAVLGDEVLGTDDAVSGDEGSALEAADRGTDSAVETRGAGGEAGAEAPTSEHADSAQDAARVGEDYAPESAGSPPQTPAAEDGDTESAGEGEPGDDELPGDDGVRAEATAGDGAAAAGDGVPAAGDGVRAEATAGDGVPAAGDGVPAEAAAGDGAPAAGDGVPGAGGDDEDYLPPGQTSVPVGDEVVVDDDTMRRAIEAILMVTDEPLPVLTLARAVGRPTGDIEAALVALSGEYTEQGRGFDLREIGGGWRYYTRPEAAPYVERFVLDGQQARLTQAALETLAVVAYKQPVSRARVSAIRGVNVDGVMRTLVSRGLVEDAGADTESHATLYRTTSYFLERMGMQSLEDLPELAPYLPEMDDIEEELAAQVLPPTTSEDSAESGTPAETDSGTTPSADPGETAAEARASEPLATLLDQEAAEPAETPAEDEAAETPAEDEPAETPAEDEPAETPAEDEAAETPAEDNAASNAAVEHADDPSDEDSGIDGDSSTSGSADPDEAAEPDDVQGEGARDGG